MNDVMVTGRMSKAKKDAGSHVLDTIGISASQLINQLYDYLIEHGQSPFAQPEKGAPITAEQLSDALARIDAMALSSTNKFASMTDDQIRQERLAAKGLWEG